MQVHIYPLHTFTQLTLKWVSLRIYGQAGLDSDLGVYQALVTLRVREW